jgi:hypothetical protein
LPCLATFRLYVTHTPANINPPSLPRFPSSHQLIYDLLVKSSGPLELREDPDQGVCVAGLKRITVTSAAEIMVRREGGGDDRSLVCCEMRHACKRWQQRTDAVGWEQTAAVLVITILLGWVDLDLQQDHPSTALY